MYDKTISRKINKREARGNKKPVTIGPGKHCTIWHR